MCVSAFVFGEFILLSVQPVALATPVVKLTVPVPCFRASHRFRGLRSQLRNLPNYSNNVCSRKDSDVRQG